MLFFHFDIDITRCLLPRCRLFFFFSFLSDAFFDAAAAAIFILMLLIARFFCR